MKNQYNNKMPNPIRFAAAVLFLIIPVLILFIVPGKEYLPTITVYAVIACIIFFIVLYSSLKKEKSV